MGSQPDFLDTIVFECPHRTWNWRQVMVSAGAAGEWLAAVERCERGEAARQLAAAGGARPTGAELQARANTYRHQHDLLAASAMQRWLKRWSLTMADWSAHLERAWALAHHSSGKAPEETCPPPSMVLADIVCHAHHWQWADRLASAAAARQAGVQVSAEFVAATRERFEKNLADAPAPAWARSEGKRELDDLARMAGALQAFTAQCAPPAAIDAVLQRHWLDWVEVDAMLLAFDREPAAREALACLKEEGDCYDAVAVHAVQASSRQTLALADLPAAVRDPILSAGREAWIGPLTIDGRFVVLKVLRKELATPDNPHAKERAVHTLVDRHLEELIDAHIVWHEDE